MYRPRGFVTARISRKKTAILRNSIQGMATSQFLGTQQRVEEINQRQQRENEPSDGFEHCGRLLRFDRRRVYRRRSLRQARVLELSLIHISEPTRLGMISYAVFC